MLRYEGEGRRDGGRAGVRGLGGGGGGGRRGGGGEEGRGGVPAGREEGVTITMIVVVLKFLHCRTRN